ncbi:uncharacterized protein LOC144168272 [Haemaphysalis longicornis]
MAREVYYVTADEPSEILADSRRALTAGKGSQAKNRSLVITPAGMEDVEEILPGFQPRLGEDNMSLSVDGTNSSASVEGSTVSEPTSETHSETAMDSSTETSISTLNASEEISSESIGKMTSEETSLTKVYLSF